MLQLIVAVVLTVAVVLFGMANSHHVELSYVMGEPIRIRMIFLLAIAFLTGAVTTYLYQMATRVSRRSRRVSRELVRPSSRYEEAE